MKVQRIISNAAHSLMLGLLGHWHMELYTAPEPPGQGCPTWLHVIPPLPSELMMKSWRR